MKVAIDPGHGGTETVGNSSPNNATGPNGTKEKDLTLEIGLSLAEQLEADGHTVSLTRNSDVNLGLAERAGVAREASADVFISLHFNGFSDPNVQGTETWVHTNHSADSNLLAQLVLARLVATTEYRDRGVRNKGLGVLSQDHHLAKTAACLAEISFLTQAADETRLQDADYKKELAGAIKEGILDFEAQASRDVVALNTADGDYEDAIA